MQRRHLTVATLHFSFLQRKIMALRLRASQNYIGVYFVSALNKWRAQSGKNTKVTIADCLTEIEAARAYNEFVRARDGFNGGFLLSRVNDVREKREPSQSDCLVTTRNLSSDSNSVNATLFVLESNCEQTDRAEETNQAA
jgi:hypothetical protein